MIGTELITKDHLGRGAVIYIRQSSPGQVRDNRESRRVQRGLAARARELGFRCVEMVEDDLGRSATGLEERPGFAVLLSKICEGRVGFILAVETARLARNNRDWYHLLDLCALTETLVADSHKVYDLRSPDDRLLLGLKGAMNEFEVGLFRDRARAAQMQMIRRGEVLWAVPVGYERTKDNRCEMTPDRQVREAIRGVFKKFDELGSVRQVLMFYRQQQIPLPSVPPGASTQEATWTVPTYSRVLALVKNPVYAGAFVYGRTETRTRVVDGRGRKTAGHAVPMQEWDVLIRDHHEGYISWEDYVRHQEILENNARMEGRMSNGATRKGAALLAGLLRCRRCGRKLHVAYSGPRSSTVRYWCRGANINHGSNTCISFAGRRTDAAVVELVAQVLAPAGVEAALVARELRASEEDEKRKSLCLGLERARYEADRARRQYDAVEPENRLVAAELEARWDSALERASDLEKELADHMAAVEPVPEWEQKRLLQLGSDLQRAFDQQSATPQAKKRILRAVIEEIVADVGEEPPEVRLTIHWAGGVHTRLGVKKNRTGHHRFCTDLDVVDL